MPNLSILFLNKTLCLPIMSNLGILVRLCFVENFFFDRKVRFIKTKGLLYPSLNTKKTEPKTNNIWEFYITRKKYRCFFRYDEKEKTIRDFENLSEEILSWKGLRGNAVSRILLVIALTNLGSTIGTFVGIPLLASFLN